MGVVVLWLVWSDSRSYSGVSVDGVELDVEELVPAKAGPPESGSVDHAETAGAEQDVVAAGALVKVIGVGWCHYDILQ